MIKANKGKVVIKLDEADKTLGGLVLPKSAVAKPQQGKVIGVGEGNPDYLKVGTTVFTPEVCGVKIPFNGETFLVVKLHEIYAYI